MTFGTEAVSALFGVVASACSNGRMGIHTTKLGMLNGICAGPWVLHILCASSFF